MSNDQVYRKYTAITLVAIVLAGFLAVVLGLNIHRMLKSDQPLVVREESTNTESPSVDVGCVRYT